MLCFHSDPKSPLQQASLASSVLLHALSILLFLISFLSAPTKAPSQSLNNPNSVFHSLGQSKSLRTTAVTQKHTFQDTHEYIMKLSLAALALAAVGAQVKTHLATSSMLALPEHKLTNI